MIKKESFGKTKTGERVSCYVLTNKNRLSASILDYGAIIHSLKVPDRHNTFEEITVGYDTLAQYEALNQYFGAFVGRFANRIRNGRFPFDGKTVQVARNLSKDHLHGGFSGFDQKCWTASIQKEGNHDVLCLKLVSDDRQEGFPGKLAVTLTYGLTDDNELVLTYDAVTDSPTVVNLASHAYFNLTGDPGRNILGHQLKISADQITAVDDRCIPTGEIMQVFDTPFDFREFHAIGKRIETEHPQLLWGGGYDHNYIVNRKDAKEGSLVPCASVYEPVSGRHMEMFATQPGLQFYSGNNLTDGVPGKNHIPLQRRHAFCLEAQHFPDSPNHDHFPTTRLDPGETYSHRLVFKFSAD